MSQCPKVGKTDIENLFSNRERVKILMKSMSQCPEVGKKAIENLFSKREREKV